VSSIPVGLLHLAAHPVSDIAYGKSSVELPWRLRKAARAVADEPLAGLSNRAIDREVH